VHVERLSCPTAQWLGGHVLLNEPEDGDAKKKHDIDSGGAHASNITKRGAADFGGDFCWGKDGTAPQPVSWLFVPQAWASPLF
jgi:hypothetical protein